jgi:SH3 domain-containing protein
VTKFDKVIPPGSEGKIYASVDTGHSDGAIQKFIDIRSNDPVHPVMKVSIKANVKVLVKSEPEYVRFDVLKGSHESTDAILSVDSSVKLSKPVSSSDMLKAELITDKTGKQKVTVTLLRTDVIGQHTVEIKIPAQGPLKEFTLPVVVYVRGPLQPNPAVVSFQVNSFPEVVTPSVATVMRSEPSPTGAVVTKLAPGRRVQVMTESNGWYQVITLEEPNSKAPGNEIGWLQNTSLKALKASEFPSPEKVQIKSALGKPFVVLGMRSTLPTVKLDQKSGTQVDQTFEFTATLQKVENAKKGHQQGEILIQTNNADQPTLRIPLYVTYM